MTQLFLSDIKSLRELKSTILLFSKYSSLEVTYEKSEAAWIGLEKENTETPKGIKWVNLCRKSILYVTSVLEVPFGFVNKVKSVILKFLWSGRKHKIKYTALIGSFCNGGIEFPDIKSRLETQRIMCIKRLVEQGKTIKSPWNHIPLHHLKNIGGARGIRTNFNIKLLSRHIPSFYKSCLSDWEKLFRDEPSNISNIMSQPVVNNTYIPVNMNNKFINFLFDNNIVTIGNLIKSD